MVGDDPLAIKCAGLGGLGGMDPPDKGVEDEGDEGGRNTLSSPMS